MAGLLVSPTHCLCMFVDPCSVDMASGLVALQTAVDLMTSNKYHEAVRLLKPKSVTAAHTPDSALCYISSLPLTESTVHILTEIFLVHVLMFVVCV